MNTKTVVHYADKLEMPEEELPLCGANPPGASMTDIEDEVTCSACKQEMESSIGH